MSHASLERLREVHARMKDELHNVIVGQDEVIEQLLLAILTRGHCLLVGVPGLAKTLIISSLAKTLDLSFLDRSRSLDGKRTSGPSSFVNSTPLDAVCGRRSKSGTNTTGNSKPLA